MWIRIVGPALVILLGSSGPLIAQRPLIGFGIGGGVILGTNLLDYGLLTSGDGGEIRINREIDQDHLGIFDAHLEVYPVPHIAVRGHGMWGSGSLQIRTVGSPPLETSLAGSGSIRVSGLDAGVSFWPWAPQSVGFTPFITVGFGRMKYEFDAADEGGFFRARGDRKEDAFLFGAGADLNVWRSFTIRIEAINHRVPSPLDPGDFGPGLTSQSGFDRRVSNVRLSLDLHICLPFRRNSADGD